MLLQRSAAMGCVPALEPSKSLSLRWVPVDAVADRIASLVLGQELCETNLLGSGGPTTEALFRRLAALLEAERLPVPEWRARVVRLGEEQLQRLQLEGKSSLGEAAAAATSDVVLTYSDEMLELFIRRIVTKDRK
jgi:hypothetical protein